MIIAFNKYQGAGNKGRGVEEETLSCGTGVTASAIVSVLTGHFDTNDSVRTVLGSGYWVLGSLK